MVNIILEDLQFLPTEADTRIIFKVNTSVSEQMILLKIKIYPDGII
jgi:hypothetical protein